MRQIFAKNRFPCTSIDESFHFFLFRVDNSGLCCLESAGCNVSVRNMPGVALARSGVVEYRTSRLSSLVSPEVNCEKHSCRIEQYSSLCSSLSRIYGFNCEIECCTSVPSRSMKAFFP